MLSNRSCLIAFLIAGLSTFISAQARADFVTLDAAADTFITNVGGLGGSGSTHGSDSQLMVGNSSRSSGGFFSSAYILVRWDLSAYAGKTVIGDGTFSLDQIAGGPNASRTIEAHQVLVGWDPASASYDNFAASQVNGFGPSVDDTVASSALIDGSQPGYTSWTLSRDLLQSWVDSPSTNNGLFLAMDGEAFFSFQSQETGLSPLLSINVASVPEPASVLLLGTGAFGLMSFARRGRASRLSATRT